LGEWEFSGFMGLISVNYPTTFIFCGFNGGELTNDFYKFSDWPGDLHQTHTEHPTHTHEKNFHDKVKCGLPLG
jgi:hypothetical protein